MQKQGQEGHIDIIMVDHFLGKHISYPELDKDPKKIIWSALPCVLQTAYRNYNININVTTIITYIHTIYTHVISMYVCLSVCMCACMCEREKIKILSFHNLSWFSFWFWKYKGVTLKITLWKNQSKQYCNCNKIIVLNIWFKIKILLDFIKIIN